MKSQLTIGVILLVTCVAGVQVRGVATEQELVESDTPTLQDLLGLPVDFAKDLPPDPVSEDGFRNSSEMLRMSPSQYADYFELNRNALNRATVRGERPEMLYWGVSAERASAHKFPTPRRTNEQSGNRTREPQTGGRQRGGRGDRDSGKSAYYMRRRSTTLATLMYSGHGNTNQRAKNQ